MTAYNLFLTHFHFVRPFWLLAVIVLFLVLWLLKKHRFHQSPWQQFLPPHLSRVLVEGSTNSSVTTKQSLQDRLFLMRPFCIGLLSIIALAGPTWEKLPQPVYQTERGSVLIMDMSYSMYATDIKPNRLTRARFKAVDLLSKLKNGDVGLIAYAGDAFVISPLTQDVKNIELLLPSLTPEIMPELGANPYAALVLAHDMLTNAGHLTGDIYWFTDDVDNEDLSDIADWTNKFGHRLNILGIGSSNGAPIKLPSGELLKDDNGAIVVPRLPAEKLQSIASQGQGNYQTIRNDDSDIDNIIVKVDMLDNNSSKQQSQQTGDQWQEKGAWLLLIVLALVLSYFRRGGSILLLPLTCLPLLLLSTSLLSPTSYANEESENSPEPSFLQETWQNLWQSKNQQAQQQYNQENYQGAAEKFSDPQWQGSAYYKAGDYEKALNAFTQGEQAGNANSLYNQGNSLAQMKKYEQAIKAYEQALKKNPNLQDAKDNIEKLKQQQQQKKEQEKNDQSDDNKSEGDKSEGDKSEGDKSEGDKSEGDKSEGDKSEGDKSEGDKSEGDKSEDDKQQEQPSKDSPSESQQKDEQKKQSKDESAKEDNKNESAQEQKSESNQGEEAQQNEQSTKEKTAAQIAAEQQEKEQSQKYQQLLNKVTDDPYLLLRNKMQLEYQKRRHNGASKGVNKKW
jgi:Ca-activated chloride channel family protein